jgi:hypothetical protein
MVYIIFFVVGGIRTKVGTCSLNETFEYEWPSYFWTWNATEKTGPIQMYKNDTPKGGVQGFESSLWGEITSTARLSCLYLGNTVTPLNVLPPLHEKNWG